MLTKRQRELLELLYQQDSFQPILYFASKLGVSPRTIHLELKCIEEVIQSSDKYLERKRGVGIVLREIEETNWIEEKKVENGGYDSFNRRIQIMYLLLFKKEKVSFNRLSETFMVSKTSIIQDLKFIMKILRVESKIALVSNVQGTKLKGDEEAFQKALLQFNRYLLSNSIVYLEENFVKRIRLLDFYYGKKLIKACTNILYTYIRENVNALSDYYMENVLNIFIILVFRISQGHHMVEMQHPFSKKNALFFEESAVNMLHKAALRLGFSYSNQDVQFLSLHLVSNHFEAVPEEEDDKRIVEGLLKSVSKALNIDFTTDRKLEEQLRAHVPPMIYRLRSENKIENPFASQIKIEFGLTFNVIGLVLKEYEEELGVKFNESEIAFLTIYFQASIERGKMNRKILVVCQLGIATSELLINRIKNILPSLDSFETASIPELTSINLEEYDLIIATIPLKIPNQEVILVSPFLTKDDVKKIENLSWKPIQVPKIVDFVQRNYLTKFVEHEHIYFNTNFSTKEELVHSVGGKLLKSGYIVEEFIQTVLDREDLAGTDLPSGTAIPHGELNYAKKTIVAIVKNKKKFKWKQYYVNIVFFIAIAKSETLQTKNILSDIYNLIEDTQQLEQLRKSLGIATFYQKLGE